MRVFHVVWTLDDLGGGLPRAVVLIASAQARAGVPVTILTTTDPDDSHRGLADLDDRVEVTMFPRSRLGRRWACSEALARHLLRAVGPDDVVHVHSVWDLPAVTGALAAGRRGARLFVSPHGSLEPHDLVKHAWAKRLLGPLVLRHLLARGTVVCTTPREAEEFVGYGADPPLRTIPLPAGDPPAHGPDPAGFRARHEIDPDAPLMLFLGRIDAKKGLGHVLRAMPHMQVPAHLVVVGSGERGYATSMRELAERLGLADRVTWAGWQSGAEKANAYATADLFVLLSDAENYGITVVEALQHDSVVAASGEVGAAAWLASTGAVLVAPRDPVGAARALDRGLTDAELRDHTRSCARAVLGRELDRAAVDVRYADLVLTDGGV